VCLRTVANLAGPRLFVDKRRRSRERFSSAIDCSPDERERFSRVLSLSRTRLGSGVGSIRHERGTNCFFSLVRARPYPDEKPI